MLGIAPVAAGLLSAAPAGAAEGYAVTATLLGGIAQSLSDPAASPAGVNVEGCVLSPARPRPVVLINGTFSNMVDDWSGLGPTLANLGYCVFGTPIGGDPHSVIQTTGAVAASARQISDVIDGVLTSTGAAQVDLVGHSQGGLIAEYYAKVLGGAAKVHTIVGISPSTHGTTLDGLTALAGPFPGANDLVGAFCVACTDQEAGSPLISALDNGPIAQPGVNYTIIETYNETVVTPAGSSFINEPGVINEWLQDYCPFNWTDHADLTYDRGVWSLVENALDPADAAAVSCW